MDRTFFLKRAIAIMGLLSLLGIAFVFIGSLAPSQRATSLFDQGRFLESDISSLAPGEVRNIDVHYGRIFAVRASPEIWESLNRSESDVYFPDIQTYSEEFDAFLFWGFADSGGRPRCAIMYNDDAASDYRGSAKSPFFDPCTGQQFDYAGRVVRTSHDMKIPNLESPEVRRVNAMEFQVLGDPPPYSKI